MSEQVPGDGTDGEEGHGPPAADFEFSLGEVPLLVATDEIEAFVENYLPLRQFFQQPFPPAGGWMASANDVWPQVPQLNTLYWPTGCTRWAFGVFLFSGEDLSAMESAVSAGFGILKMGDSADPDHYIEAKVVPLSPIPITGDSARSNKDDGYPLYLLPVVDARYEAQRTVYSDTGEAGQDVAYPVDLRQATRFYRSAVGQLSTDFNDHFNALPDYQQNVEMSCITSRISDRLASGAQVAEAAGWSACLTMIRELDGANNFMHRTAATGYDTNENRLNQLIQKVNDGTFDMTAGYVAGATGEATLDNLLKPGVPANLTLLSCLAAGDLEDERYYIVSGQEFITGSSEFLPYQGMARPWTVVTPIVPQTYDPKSEDVGKLKALSYDLAYEWFSQVGKPIDATFADICRIPFSAHTDVVEWHFGGRGPQTRVRSRKWNQFPNRLINQLPVAEESRRAPNRWERVAIEEDGGQVGTVKFNGKVYNAFLPILQEGFKKWDKGTTVIAGWNSRTQEFFVCDQRPIDWEVLSQKVADWLTDHNYFGGGGGGGGGPGIGGGAL